MSLVKPVKFIMEKCHISEDDLALAHYLGQKVAELTRRLKLKIRVCKQMVHRMLLVARYMLLAALKGKGSITGMIIAATVGEGRFSPEEPAI